MILVLLLVVTFVSGILTWLLSLVSRSACRVVCFLGLAVDAVLILNIWINRYDSFVTGTHSAWIIEYKIAWIDALGINFHLALDGLGLLLAALTVLLGLSSVAASWKEINEHIGAFHFALMSVLTGILGIFTAADIFLFYFFWELMLVPMFFLILIWGHENKTYAAIKFFIFTQAGALFMLLAIIAVYWISGEKTGSYTFDYSNFLAYSGQWGPFIMLGFFVAFAVKLPAVPLHLWLPDAHTQAPTAGSVVLAGLLLKTGAFGMIRFVLPMLTAETEYITHLALWLGIVGIFYGAVLAFGQQDLKRLVAYTSISHLGFVLLGIFSGSQMALQGAVVVMLAHGLSTGALFIIIGALQHRTKTRDMDMMGGLWSALPRMGGMTLFFVLASLGLPGLANFVGEFLVLAGTYQTYPWFAAAAAFGFVVSTVYSLWLLNKVFHGPAKKSWQSPDIGFGEMINLSVLAATVIWIGLFPQIVLNTANANIGNIKSQQKENIYRDSQEADSVKAASSGSDILISKKESLDVIK